MTTKSVANELLDARDLYFVWVSPHGTEQVGPDVVFIREEELDGEILRFTSMAYPYEVDGIRYPEQMNGNSRHIISIRDDQRSWCQPDDNGFCRCVPAEYQPLPHSRGEICEPCWLVFAVVEGNCQFIHN